jgi:uncharacterized repeat protein (TIGR03803 family)
MKSSLHFCYVVGVVLAFGLSAAIPAASSDTETVIAAFTGNSGAYVGSNPFFPNLIRDASGNLYGTASGGGNPDCVQFTGHACGVIFQLTPVNGGAWKENIVYSFGGGTDGSAAGTLVLDAKGILYAVTSDGGNKGFGTFFKLTPNSGPAWKKTVLHNFGGGARGATPAGNLVADAAGNFYGTTAQGGNVKCSMGEPPLGCGIVFRFSRGPRAPWKETVLYTFKDLSDGLASSELAIDAQGNLFGATIIGGPDPNAAGTVFKLSPKPTGSWPKTILYTFIYGTNGSSPAGGVILDAAGNLYGATTMGGDMNCGHGGCGTVYQLTPTPNGPWQETSLHIFEGGSDGISPWGRLAFDSQGNLFGTTSQGGNACSGSGCGTVFELAKSIWTETVIHSFAGGNDGIGPLSGVIVDPLGQLYGTTVNGGGTACGGGGCGTVYQISANR